MYENLSKLLSSPLMNLDHVYRYSGIKQQEMESIAIHTFEVQMLGTMIIDTLQNYHNEKDLDINKFLNLAFHHDLEEAITGDIPRPLKYHDSNIHESLNSIAELVAKDLFRNNFLDCSSHYKSWSDAKSGKEGLIVKLADTLTVVSKTIKEIELLGNKYFLKVALEVRYYLNELAKNIACTELDFNYHSKMYMNDLLLEASNHLGNILSKYSEIIDTCITIDNTMINNNKGECE